MHSLQHKGSNSATSSRFRKDTSDHGHGAHGKDALIHSDQHAGAPSTSSAPAEQLVEIKAAPDLHSKVRGDRAKCRDTDLFGSNPLCRM